MKRKFHDKEKIRDLYRLTAGKQLGWSGRSMFLGSSAPVLTYITIYCTNMLSEEFIIITIHD